jgi:hypothetical protein
MSDRHHHEHHHRHHHRLTHSLGIVAFNIAGITIKGAHMDLTIAVGSAAAQGVVSGLLADGVTPSGATLSNLTFTDSNPAVCTGVLDTTTPNAIDETAVAAGSEVLSFTASFVDTNGATGTASGQCNITVTGGTGTQPLTTSLTITWNPPSQAPKGVKLSR